MIKDHDPGLRKTKGLLLERGDKPNLSQMLRDAKEQREVQERQEQASEEARKAHFGSLFDEFQGMFKKLPKFDTVYFAFFKPLRT